MAGTGVLVVGGGPTGLTLACDLARRGVPVRVVDRARAFPHGSRGKGLTPRTLEVLDDLGVIERVLESGATHLPFRKYRGTEVVAEVDPEADRVVTPDTPYPTALLIAQWRVEQILRERLADLGVTVELAAELREFTQHSGGVTATVGDEEIAAEYLVGCDGGRSGVRRALGIGFAGRTSETQRMAIGDVELEGLSRDAWHQWFAGDGFMMLCPLPGTDAFQVQASHERSEDGALLEPTLERFQRTFDRVAGVPGVRFRNLTWQSTYRVNVRMVDRFRAGRAFLAGDSAHVHSIAGGLGMNSGIQDAYNLGWKLGLVLGGRGGPGLLDTYDEERLPIASWLLDLTSQQTEAVLEAIKAPGGGVDAVVTPETSQLRLGYRRSSLSRDTAGRPHPVQAGDRAPDAPCRDPLTGSRTRLFDVFRGPHSTLLGIGARSAPTLTGIDTDLVEPCLIGGDGLVDDHGDVARAYGDDLLVLVRPDGYVGLVADVGDARAVPDYLRSW